MSVVDETPEEGEDLIVLSESAQSRVLDIARANDGLKPEMLVEDARDPLSPLHEKFEWDDAVAGPKWRMQQARQIIRSFKLTYSNSSGTEQAKVRAFTFVPSQKRYRETQSIVHDPSIAREVLENFASGIQNQISLYAQYERIFPGAKVAITEARALVEKIRSAEAV